MEDINQNYSKYLKPKKDPHIRIGKEFQAVLPGSNEEAHHTKVEITETLTIEEEIEMIKKPHKKRKID